MAMAMTEHETLTRIKHHFSGVFKRIIPPQNRMWMWDCIHIDAHRSMQDYGMAVRIMFRPRNGVVPEQQLAMEFNLEDGGPNNFDRIQHVFEGGPVEDFILKLLMVYSMGREG